MSFEKEAPDAKIFLVNFSKGNVFSLLQSLTGYCLLSVTPALFVKSANTDVASLGERFPARLLFTDECLLREGAVSE
jgi:hypothetical protein